MKCAEKVVVAVSDEDLPKLEELKGQTKGLTGIRKLNPKQIREIEPHCSGLKGLYVPITEIVDFSQIVKRMVDKGWNRLTPTPTV